MRRSAARPPLRRFIRAALRLEGFAHKHLHRRSLLAIVMARLGYDRCHHRGALDTEPPPGGSKALSGEKVAERRIAGNTAEVGCGAAVVYRIKAEGGDKKVAMTMGRTKQH